MGQESQKIHNINIIDYMLIAKSIEYYQKIGYDYIEVPWLVDEESIKVTHDGDVLKFLNHNNILVGSAEQSFIYMMLNGIINGGGKVMAVTPCFRLEKYDALHRPYFFKTELIHILEKNDDELKSLKFCINNAKHFFANNSIDEPVIVKTDIGYDINLNDIEIGSYGIRSYKKHRWVYGTGLAEPRFSTANYSKYMPGDHKWQHNTGNHFYCTKCDSVTWSIDKRNWEVGHNFLNSCEEVIMNEALS